MTRLAPMVIVYERRPRWESELKREIAGEGGCVRPCRSAGDLLTLCRSAPGSVAVIDLSVGPPVILRWLEQICRERLDVFPLVIEAGEPGDFEWPLRELGAQMVCPATVSGNELAGMCRRFRGGDYLSFWEGCRQRTTSIGCSVTGGGGGFGASFHGNA